MSAHRLPILAALVACAVFGARPAFAGPPLLCFPFDIGQARSLPMASTANNWRTIDPSYDSSRVVDDTMALLGADTPIIVRMETLRRATIYASTNLKTGRALLSALEARAKSSTPDAALSMFDLGYLVETFRQGSYVFEKGALPSVADIDGYALVQKAMTFRADPQIEFAEAIISGSPRRVDYAEHVRNVEAASKNDLLIASNLSTRFQQ